MPACNCDSTLDDVCLCARWSYGRCSQAQQERMWNEDQSATGRSHLHTAVVDTDDLPYLSSWTGHRVDVHVVYLSIGLVVRWYAPVWYTGTSLVGLKSYRHSYRPTAIPVLKSLKSLRPDAFPKYKICQKRVCGAYNAPP